MRGRIRLALAIAGVLAVPAGAWAQASNPAPSQGTVAATTTTTICYQALSDVILCGPNPPPPGAAIVPPTSSRVASPGDGGCVAVNRSVCSGSGLAENGSDSSGCATALNDSTASGGDCRSPRPTPTTVFIDIVPRPPTAPPAQPSPSKVSLTG